jgi:hypothetical protein
MDPWLFFAAVALTGLGLVMVYSAGAWLGHSTYSGWEHFLTRQAMFAVAGFVLMVTMSRLDYRLLRRFAPQLMLGAIAMLLMVLVFGTEINGARRWIRVGSFSLQPSELAKVALAVFLAATLARKGERVRAFTQGFLPVMVISGFTMILVLMEKDLGTTILLGSLTLIMLFVAGTRLSYVVAAVMLAAPIAWQQILGVDYRRGRLEEFLSGDGYQVQQALISIGSGGWFGLGLLPAREPHRLHPRDRRRRARFRRDPARHGVDAAVGLARRRDRSSSPGPLWPLPRGWLVVPVRPPGDRQHRRRLGGYPGQGNHLAVPQLRRFFAAHVVGRGRTAAFDLPRSCALEAERPASRWHPPRFDPRPEEARRHRGHDGECSAADPAGRGRPSATDRLRFLGRLVRRPKLAVNEPAFRGHPQ